MQSYLKERNVFVVIVLNIITWGVYGLFLFFIFGGELRSEAESQRTETQLGSVGLAFLLTLITLGIYGIYYTYQQSKVIKELGDKNGIAVMDPVVICILTIFIGLGFILNVYYASLVAQAVNRRG